MTSPLHERRALEILLFRLFKAAQIGFYIKISSNASEDDDLTQALYDGGWRGVCASGNERYLERLSASRPGDVHINLSTGRRRNPPSGPGAHLGALDVSDVPATASDTGLHVMAASLAAAFSHADTLVDFLQIEAADQAGDVIASIDWTAHRPRVVIAAPHRDDTQSDVILMSSGYTLGFSNDTVRLYCRNEDRNILLPRMQVALDADLGWTSVRERTLERALTYQLRACGKLEANCDQLRQERDEAQLAHAQSRHQLAAAGDELTAALNRSQRAEADRYKLPGLVLPYHADGSTLDARASIQSRLRRRPFMSMFGDNRVERAMAMRLSLVCSSGLFEPEWYYERYPDVAADGVDAALHFVNWGSLELRDPGPSFDGGAYLRANLDVARAQLEPFLHYLVHGRYEGRFSWRAEH